MNISQKDLMLDGDDLELHMWEQPTSKLVFVISRYSNLHTNVQIAMEQRYVAAAMKEIDRRIPPGITR